MSLENFHIDFQVLDGCQNVEESYGEICVGCNKCGRLSGDNSNPELSAKAEAAIEALFNEVFDDEAGDAHEKR